MKPKYTETLQAGDPDRERGLRARPIAMPKEVGGGSFPIHMRPREAARYLGLAESTLAKLRMRGRSGGPGFCRVGGAVIYRRSDLDAWLAANVVE